MRNPRSPFRHCCCAVGASLDRYACAEALRVSVGLQKVEAFFFFSSLQPIVTI